MDQIPLIPPMGLWLRQVNYVNAVTNEPVSFTGHPQTDEQALEILGAYTGTEQGEISKNLYQLHRRSGLSLIEALNKTLVRLLPEERRPKAETA